MMRTTKPLVLLVIIAAVGACAPDAAAPGVGEASLTSAAPGRRCYVVHSLGTLGGNYSTASRVNRWGQVVGESLTAAGLVHAFFAHHGRLVDLGSLTISFSHALDVNDRGEVVGASGHPFLWRWGRMIDLGTLGGDTGAALRINERSQIVGTSTTSTGETDAFFWEHGRMVALETLGGAFSAPFDLDERGQVVGYSEDAAAVRRAVLWRRDGRVVDLGTPAGADSLAVAMNERTEIVGSFQTVVPSGYSRHAFLWRRGALIDLGTLGGDYSSATAINDRGEIVGESTSAAGELHGFLWRHGAMLDLGAGAARPAAINDRGQVVGTTEATDAFEWDHGVLTPLPPLGARGGIAVDINAHGLIVGISHDDVQGNERGVVWEPVRCSDAAEEASPLVED